MKWEKLSKSTRRHIEQTVRSMNKFGTNQERRERRNRVPSVRGKEVEQ